MAVKDDILTLKTEQEKIYAKEGRYVQCLPTPAEVPTKDAVSEVTKLIAPTDEKTEIAFTPTAKDYQFAVNVWSRKDGDKETKGYCVVAKRDLGDGLIETISSENPVV